MRTCYSICNGGDFLNMDETHTKFERLTGDPVSKLILRLAVPTVLSQLVNMLYNIVDRIFIGHIEGIGDLALTGVGVCMPLIMLVSAFAFLASAGGAPRASIFLGEGNQEDAEKWLTIIQVPVEKA